MKKHSGKTIDRKEGKKIIDCKSCGFVHVHPTPTEKELKEFYEKEFYQYERPNYFKETKEDLPWWMATYDSYYKIFEKQTKGRRLLDIGSGPGHFLACGQKRGWETVGIEPSPVAAEYSRKRGLETQTGFFTYENAKKLGKFDVVHAALVLEHVPDPINFITEMSRLLKKGGLIAIFCPNDYNPLQNLLHKDFKMDPWWVVPRHHLNYFNPQSMEKLLVKLGFETEEIMGTYPLETFILSGRNYVGNHTIGRACHKERKSLEMMIYKKHHDILDSLYGGLIRAGIGREFLIIARKK